MSIGPTYVTQSKHGIYYFQVRTTALLRQKYGFTGKLIRKSLRTKIKRIALTRARYIWLLLFERQLFAPMTKSETPSPDEQGRIIQKAQEVNKLISEFIYWQLGYDAIHPNDDWGREQYIDSAPRDIEFAIKHINDNNIDINELVYPDSTEDKHHSSMNEEQFNELKQLMLTIRLLICI